MTLPDPLGEAVEWVGAGGLLAFPTETQWALGADAGSQAALDRLCRWKTRAAEAPISVLVADAEEAGQRGLVLDGAAEQLAARFWPGPLTLVVRAERPFAAGIANPNGAVGVRCSPHPLAGVLCRGVRRAGCGPLTATSLNRSGEPAATLRHEAAALCGEGPDEPRLLGVEGAEAGGGEPSTVIDTTCVPPRVLRWGAVRAEALGACIDAWSED